MEAAMIGLVGLMLAGGIGWVSWLKVAAPRNARRTSSRVEAELRALGLDGHPAPARRGKAEGGHAAPSRRR